ncbi:MAG: hypothetical protein IJU52_07270 [Clostridia bacterium]|nr:hypothetical protein [Clostridia bacterium]
MDRIGQLREAKQYVDNLITSKHPATGEDIHADFLRVNSVLIALLQVSRALGDAVKDEQIRAEGNTPEKAKLKELEEKAAKLSAERDSEVKDLNDRIAALKKESDGTAKKLQGKIEKLTSEKEAAAKELRAVQSENEKLRKEAEDLRASAQTASPSAESRKEKSKPAPLPKQKPRVVHTECSVLCRGAERTVPIVKGQVSLESILDRINEAFAEDNVKVSLNKLTTILKDRNILTMGKAGNQMRLIPTKLGEYYGVTLTDVCDESGVNKKVPVYNEHGQYFVLSSLSEMKEKKGPFEYLPDLIKVVPVTTDEISLSEIVARINDVYQNEPMVQLQFAAVTNFLFARGVLVPNPEANTPKAPKFIPAEGMRSKGIRFYPADARHAARTVYNILGQRFVLRELAFMGEEK